MALDFIEELYKDANLITSVQIMIRYLNGYKYKLFLDCWASLTEDMVFFSKKTISSDQNLGAYIWKEFTNIKVLIEKKLYVETADELENLIPYLIKAMELRGNIDVEEDGYRLFSSKSGFLSVQNVKSGELLLSSNNPMLEAYAESEAVYYPQMQKFVSIGCTLGYLEWQVYKRTNESVDIFIYDNDEKWIQYAYDYGVLSWIPEDKIHIYINSNSNKLINDVIDNHQDEKSSTSLYICDRVYNNLSGDAKILGGSISQSVVTKANFYSIVEQNFYSNFQNVDNFIEGLKPDIKQKEWIVVGGGPSVDDYIDYLRDNKGKKIIIAASTIYKRLLMENIIPDYIAVIDMQNRTYGHLDGVNQFEPTLIMADCANWQFGRKYLGKKYIIPTSGMSFSEKTYDALKIKPWSVGGTVTAVSMQVAIKMGASSIELIGVDLSYPNNYSHAKGTMDYALVDNSKYIQVKSVDGGKVNTDYVMKSYILEIEGIIANNPKVKVVNLSKHGAYIRGCK